VGESRRQYSASERFCEMGKRYCSPLLLRIITECVGPDVPQTYDKPSYIGQSFGKA
jgi:hypothetical protein